MNSSTVCPKNFLTFERPFKGLFNGLWVLNLVSLESSNTAFLGGKIIFIGVYLKNCLNWPLILGLFWKNWKKKNFPLEETKKEEKRKKELQDSF